jgi:NAD(P)-dependent dehydrogenase (short-subunit alcohol dehydrogenase family)
MAAEALAKAGAHVVAVARTVGGLEELDDAIRATGGEASLVPLDLKDAAGIDRLAAIVFERWGRLDALFGNAGVLGVLTPLAHLQPKDWDELLAVNVTSNLQLIRVFDPLLRRSQAGRALFVTSGVAHRNRPFWGGYAITKAALDAMVLTYAAECATTNVRVNLYSPGPTRTAMYIKAFPGVDENTLPAPETHNSRIVELLSPAYSGNGELIKAKR